MAALHVQYTEDEFKLLVAEFRDHDVPLDVLVIDMDCTVLLLLIVIVLSHIHTRYSFPSQGIKTAGLATAGILSASKTLSASWRGVKIK